MANFRDILSVPAASVKKPEPVPQGTYLCMVQKYETGESKKQKTPFVRIHMKPIQAQEDVDSGELENFGGTEALGKRSFTKDFYLTEDATYRLTEFLSEVVGVDLSGDKSLAEALQEVLQQQILVNIQHTMSDDGKDVYVNVASLAPVE